MGYKYDGRKYNEVQMGLYVNEKGELMVKYVEQVKEREFVIRSKLVEKILDPWKIWSSFRFE